MNTKTGLRVVVVGVLVCGAAFAAWRFWPRLAASRAPERGGPDPTKRITVTTATNYPAVDFKPTEIDLSRYELNSGWRYHGSVS